jgi:pilus assembly protein Flp/PilA
LGRAFWQDEDGATAIEYALLASAVSVTMMGGLSSMGITTAEVFNTISEALGMDPADPPFIPEAMPSPTS